MTLHITLRSPLLSRGWQPALLCFVFSFLLALWFGAAWRPALAQANAMPGAQADQDARPLVVGQPVERELIGGQNHSYKITLEAGQYLNAVVEQRGIDVVVTLLGPDGKQLIEVDSPNGKLGPEPVSWIVEAVGDYRLAVRSLEKNAAGRYEVKIIELRAATEQDLPLVEARKFFNEAVILRGKRKYAEAIFLAERAAEIWEKALGPEHPEFSVMLENLVALYNNKGDYAKAAPLFQRLLAIREKDLGPEHPDLVNSIITLGQIYYFKGDYAKTEPLLQRALAIREKALGSEHPDLADFLNNLANLYRDMIKDAKAESLYQRALAIQEKNLGPEHPSVANSLRNIASLYNIRRDFAKVEPLLQRALAIQEKNLGPEHPLIADSLKTLASSYSRKGDFAKAEPLYQRALAIREKALGPEHPQVANLLESFAHMYEAKQDYSKAELLYQRALAIREKALGPEHLQVANLIAWLVFLQINKGDEAKVEPLLKRWLVIVEKVRGSEHSSIATPLTLLGRLHWAREEMAQAVESFRRAAEVDESELNRKLAYGSEREKLANLARLSLDSDRIISLHLHSPSNDSTARDLAITTILRRKGRAMDAITDTLATLRRRATPQDQALLDELKDIRSQLARLTLNGPERTTPAEHQARVKGLEDQNEKLEAEISSRSAEFRSLSQPVTIGAVQAAIPEKSALVEFFAYRPFNPKAKLNEAFGAPRYVAYVMRRGGDTRWVELGEAKAIDETVDKLRQALRDPKRQDVKQLAREVDRLVMDPLRPLIGKTRRVFLSPDGALNLVPFAALVDKSGHYLVNHYEFSYLSSGRDLLRLQVKRPGNRSAMVVANPDFGESARNGAEGRRGIKLKYQAPPPAPESENSILSDAFFPPLPGTADEAAALRAMLPKATVLTGAQATEAAIKRAPNPGILHIATHGFFLSDLIGGKDEERLLEQDGLAPESPVNVRVENPLLRSGLALAGANLRKPGPGQEDDGVLTASEASALDLWGTKLVVLSACDTGVGEIRTGDGVHGLRRALALAGAETQVMSLWPVSDKATRDLMIEYYKKLLDGSGRSEALREAQLRMLAGGMRASDGSSRLLSQSARQRATGRTKDYSHPYYWACFIQSGEWANLDGKRQ
ncbi:MAG TPA: CHAT domain-containing tetratricopeptide repeat protein [Blastocatellia bacterium]|nr:CHAT domain-containing tetratricopeptide repeat protein [Blastocatellia bacterium]